MNPRVSPWPMKAWRVGLCAFSNLFSYRLLNLQGIETRLVVDSIAILGARFPAHLQWHV